MTNVFQIRNDANKVVVDGSHMVPQFIGKIVTKDDNIRSQDGAEQGFQSRSYSGRAPDFGGRDVIIFWTFPPDVWWYIPSPFMHAGSSGTPSAGLFALCSPGAYINGVPEGYVFALGHVNHSGVNPALRTWDPASGKLLFDSGALHLAIEGIGSNVSYPYDWDRNVGLGIGGKRAFLVPNVTRYAEQFEGALTSENGMATAQNWLGVVKYSGGALFTRMLLAYNVEAPASNPGSRAGYNEDQTFGNTDGLLMPMINASLYD